MRNYKANLSILNTRYSDTERRVLEWFADNGLDKALLLEGGTLLELTTRNLVRDGLVQVTDARGFRSVSRLTLSDGRQLGMIPASLPRLYELTALGRESAEKWLRAALMG